MKHYQKLPKPESVSQLGRTRPDFEFPTTLGVQQNNIVFCGKVITRRVEPIPTPHQTKRQSNMFVASLRLPYGKESRCHRSGNESKSRSGSVKKSYIGVFGMIKLPLQMELSDIKMRQERRESLPKLPTEDGVSFSCWQMVRSLRKKGMLMSALKASFGCTRIA